MVTHTRTHRRSAQSALRYRQGRQRRLRLATVALAIVAVLAAGGWLLGDRLGGNDTGVSANPYDGLPVNGTVIGDDDVPVLVEYGDYYCPHCQEFALDHESQLIQDYVRSGKLRYEFRPMPVLGGDLADPANPSVRLAEASYAALAQGVYWEFHKQAMETTAGTERGTRLSDDDILGIARGIVPDIDRFTTEFRSGMYRQQVLDTYNQGMALGMNGVPSFFLDDRTSITWTGDYVTFERTLDTALTDR